MLRFLIHMTMLMRGCGFCYVLFICSHRGGQLLALTIQYTVNLPFCKFWCWHKQNTSSMSLLVLKLMYFEGSFSFLFYILILTYIVFARIIILAGMFIVDGWNQQIYLFFGVSLVGPRAMAATTTRRLLSNKPQRAPENTIFLLVAGLHVISTSTRIVSESIAPNYTHTIFFFFFFFFCF